MQVDVADFDAQFGDIIVAFLSHKDHVFNAMWSTVIDVDDEFRGSSASKIE